MSVDRETIKSLYEQLKGTRTRQGKLYIQDFDEQSYEDLYFYLLDVLAPYFENDYYSWYNKVVKQYVRYRQATNRRYDFSCVQNEKYIEDHTIQEQLAVIKFFIYRRATSNYKSKQEE